jgi:putative flippase GtrA
MRDTQRQFLRFVIAGAIGFVVDAGVLWVSLRLGLGYFAGRAISFLAAAWVTWQINRRITFSGAARGAAWAEWWRYLFAMSGGGSMNYGVYSMVVLTLPQSPFVPFYGVAAGSIAGMVINFASAKWWVFRHRQKQ